MSDKLPDINDVVKRVNALSAKLDESTPYLLVTNPDMIKVIDELEALEENSVSALAGLFKELNDE